MVAKSSTRMSMIAKTMMNRVEHRGPDDYGWMSLQGQDAVYGRGMIRDELVDAVLVHRRLSILDLSSAGRQPMSSVDGRYHIVFNGEIYNYRELRQELQQAGHVFVTQSDTEVLLAAFLQWGELALTRLIGMFAFAVLDVCRRRLFLARDFFGIKPLFYTHNAVTFAFASEIKALLHTQPRPKMNAHALYWYLNTGVTNQASHSLVDGIHSLPPAHYAWISLERPEQIEVQQYWSIDTETKNDLSFPEAAAKLRELFVDSVRLHLRSDVPVGATLSGGIDSSSIVQAARQIAGRSLDFHNFSFIADEKEINEESWIDLVSRQANTVVHKVRLTAAELSRDVDDLISMQDEPFGSTSVYAQYRVFKLAQQTGIKVMLDGQGADEMLAGYRSYLPTRLHSLIRSGRTGEAVSFYLSAMRGRNPQGAKLLADHLGQRLPKSMQAFYGASADAVAGWLRKRPAFSEPKICLNRDWFVERQATGALLEGVQFDDTLRGVLLQSMTASSLPMLLRYEDRNSMGHGIESRVPFLTPQIVQFVFSLPEEYLLSRRGTSKHVFRTAMRGITPDKVLDRRDKIGFTTPEHKWLQSLRPWVNDVLGSDAAKSLTCLHHQEVRDECNAILDGRSPFNWRMWRWLNLIRWSDHYNVSC